MTLIFKEIKSTQKPHDCHYCQLSIPMETSCIYVVDSARGMPPRNYGYCCITCFLRRKTPETRIFQKRTCPHPHKVKYESKKDAVKALKQMHRVRGKPMALKGLQIFYCKTQKRGCAKWHIGHKKDGS